MLVLHRNEAGLSSMRFKCDLCGQLIDDADGVLSTGLVLPTRQLREPAETSRGQVRTGILTGRDSSASSMLDCFDFTQASLPTHIINKN
jgi:hypothetical protein